MNHLFPLPTGCRWLPAAFVGCLLTAGTISQAAAQAYMANTFAGTGTAGYNGDGTAATSAQLQYPNGVAVDGSGNVYIADQYNHRVRKVSTSGTITTIAGTGTAGFSGDGGPATSARLNGPTKVLADNNGNVYISDSNNNRVRKVDAAGNITTIAGTGAYGSSGDGGPATSAQLNGPSGLSLDGVGNLYIVDGGNQRIRKVGTSGTITTFAGTSIGYSGDGGPATSARFTGIEDLVFDGSGNAYITDNSNNRVRKVDAAGTITTFAGTGAFGSSGDGGPATSAELSAPTGITIDGAGNIYFEDNYNKVRKVSASGTITAFAGTGTNGSGGDGGPATSAQFNSLSSIAFNRTTNVFYLADRNNQRIRQLALPANAAPTALALSPSSIAENVAAGSVVGTFTTTDPDAGNTFTYALVSGTGDTDNASFSIGTGANAGKLLINLSPDYETKSSYAVRVQTTDQGGLTFVRTFTIAITDVAEPLTISSGTVAAPTDVPAGLYTTLTVSGVARLAGNVTVNTAVNVQNGGTLYDGCFIISGAGSFTLAAGGTLGICSTSGISNTPSTGTVQVTGARSFSTDASYVYTTGYPVIASRSSAPASPTANPVGMVTGSALPAQVRNLTAATVSIDLGLSQSVAVTQVLKVMGTQNLLLNGYALTLPSTAAGTALVVNTNTGIVSGSTATLQRYIGANTAGTGYRHYASPMQGETLGTLATTGYTPDFTGGAAYNAAATPGTVTPFPTVYGYDESRTANAGINFGAPFDRGWLAATAGTQAMTPGRGYSVNAPGTALVDFTGTPTSGNVTLNNLAFTGADGGWQLLGNPYPAPLDWSTVPVANRPNMNAAMYVFQSTGPYAGQYRTYLPALNQGDPLVPAGAGFFVRTAAQGVAGSVTLTNTNRVTTFGAQPVFGRGTADLRPRVQLTLGNAAGTLADELTVYADPAATTGLDAEYDATKLANGTGLNLSAVAATGAELAIAGLPALTPATVLPLRLGVPATGTFQLAATVANLPAGLTAYLRDLTTGTQTALTATTTLSLTAGLSTRYALAFAPAGALAATAGLSAAQVAVFPNPAAKGAGVTVTLPVTAGQQATAEVRDALGRVVLAARALRVSGGQATGELPTAGLAAGVYVLRLTAGATAVSKRLVVE